MNRFITIAAICLASAWPWASPATTHTATESHAAHHPTLTDGEVRRVDKEQKKLTIRHGAIANLDMPPMTMVFQVQDPSLLEIVKPGDKIKFTAENIGGTYTVTRLESVR